MTPDEIAALAAVAQAVLALLTLIATVAVAVLVYLGGRKIARLQHDHDLRNAWNALDTAALSDDELLVVADNLLPPSPEPGVSLTTRKRKWFAYMILNAIVTRFVAAKAGESLRGVNSDKMIQFHLQHLMLHEDIYQLTQTAGYEDDFAELCRNMRKKVTKSKS